MLILFVLFFAMSGLWQSIGWPSYIAVIGNWFPRKYRGLIFGFWWSCENTGNIGGNLFTNFLVTYYDMNWMQVFRTIAIFVGIFGVVNFFFLVDHPSKFNFVVDSDDPYLRTSHIDKDRLRDSSMIHKRQASIESGKDIENRKENLLSRNYNNKISTYDTSAGISFLEAWAIPGVLMYAICNSFVKLSTYGILYWLPSYAKYQLHYNTNQISRIAISYDLGVIIGNVIIGRISDLIYGKRAPVVFFSLFWGATSLLVIVFMTCKQDEDWGTFLNHYATYIMLVLIFLVGFWIGTVFNIISATAAADLARNSSLKNNDKALATLGGIMDGSGSFGAAVGSYLIGYIRTYSWRGMFMFLSAAVYIGAFAILKVCIREIREIRALHK